MNSDRRSEGSTCNDAALPFQPQPVREFCGHEDDIFDLSWSSNLFLLSASRDKTVRLWHVLTDGALKVFRRALAPLAWLCSLLC